MSDKPVMNGADKHLEELEERLVNLASQFQRAESELNPDRVKKFLSELQDVSKELRMLIDRIMDIRTLAQPGNWRLRMQYDLELYKEFIRIADDQMLVLAIREMGEPAIKKILAVVEKAKMG